MEALTSAALRRQTTERLRASGIHGAAHEANLLLTHVLGISLEAQLLHGAAAVDEGTRQRLEHCLRRRLEGEPLQLILGSWSFMGLEMLVRRGVLIPRQDTETLCEEALRFAQTTHADTALELGVGSGAVAVALARLGALDVTATDISREALALAAENAQRNGVALTLLEGSWFAPVEGQKFHLIVSNPPYIPRKEIPMLMREVRDYEPFSALCGGEDGLCAYREIIQGAAAHLYDGGALLLEVGYGQSSDVRAMLVDWAEVWTVPDMAGVERVVGAKL